MGLSVYQAMQRCAGPGQFNFLDDLIAPQSKVYAFVGRTRITARRCDLVALDQAGFCSQLDPRPDSIAVALGAHSFNRDPMITARRGVVKKLGRASDR